jgi:hypothetical protein
MDSKKTKEKKKKRKDRWKAGRMNERDERTGGRQANQSVLVRSGYKSARTNSVRNTSAVRASSGRNINIVRASFVRNTSRVRANSVRNIEISVP